MTFLEAAIKILYENDNIPMKPRDIWKEIDKQKLVKTDGKTPWASLNTIMLFGSINSTIGKDYLDKEPDKNKNIFDIVSNKPNTFRLNQTYLDTRYDVEESEEVIEEIEQEQIPEPTENKKIVVSKEREIIYQMTCEELEWKCLTIYKDDDHIDYEISNITEYTYVFDGNNTLVKIGKTSQETPVNRLNGMKTANPAIHIALVFPATLYKEKHLHDKFDDYRQQNNREWFFKSKTILGFINNHLKKNEIALKWYYKQKEIKEIETKIINW